MPGVSSRADVPGAKGIGKVRLRFRPISETKKSKIGFYVFLWCLFMILFSLAWKRSFLRYGIQIPILQRVSSILNKARIGSRPINIKTAELSENAVLSSSAKGKFDIEAHSLHDAVYLQGYLHAHEYLFEMDFARRAGYGQLSELFGEEKLSHDIFASSLNFADRAMADLAVASDEERSMLETYARGVNNYLDSLTPFSYPIEYLALYGVRLWFDSKDIHRIKPWSSMDSLVVLRMMYFQRSHGWTQDLTQFLLKLFVDETSASQLFAASPPSLVPGGFSDHHVTGLGGTVFVGKTQAGETVLGADYHRQVDDVLPSSLILRMAYPGGNVSGLSMAGVPLILSGHNNDISWAYSTAAVDNSDLVFEDTSAKDVLRRVHSIAVKPLCRLWLSAACKPTTTPVELLDTRHGPIISGSLLTTVNFLLQQRLDAEVPRLSSKFKVALYAASLQERVSLLPFLRMNQARDWDSFAAAAGSIRGVSLNVAFADAQGNIGYVVTGTPLNRPAGLDGVKPYFGQLIDEAKAMAKIEAISTISNSQDMDDNIDEAVSVEVGGDGSASAETISRDDMLHTVPKHGLLAVYNPAHVDYITFDDARNATMQQANTKYAQLLRALQSKHEVNPSDLLSLLQDTLSPSALTIRNLILAVQADAAPSSASHFSDEGANAVIKRVQALVMGFDGHMHTGLQSQPTSQPMAAVAPTIIEAVRVELWNILLQPLSISGMGAALKGQGFTPWGLEDSSRLSLDLASLLAPSSANYWTRTAGGSDLLVRQAIIRAMQKCEGAYGVLPVGDNVAVGASSSREVITYARGRVATWLMARVVQPILGMVKAQQLGFVHPWDWAKAHAVMKTTAVPLPLVLRVALSRGPYPYPGGADSSSRSAFHVQSVPEDVPEIVSGTISAYRMITVSDKHGMFSEEAHSLFAPAAWLPNNCAALCVLKRLWLQQDADVIAWFDGTGHDMSRTRINGTAAASIQFVARP